MLDWLQKRLANEFWILLISIVVLGFLFYWLGGILMPVIISIVFAYLLDGIVLRLERWKVPHVLAVSIVCLLLIGLLVLAIFVLAPLIWAQLLHLVTDLPNTINKSQNWFIHLSQRYPDYISPTQVQKIMAAYQNEFAYFGKKAITVSLSTLSSVMSLIVYLILVPLMVFFFMKDKKQILTWISNFLPKKRKLMGEVWQEVNTQIANYIRAKALEIIIVSIISTTAFALLGLQYSVLLGVLVGLSALIPYVGVIIVTIPVAIIGYLQWGFSPQFGYLALVYLGLMTLDGNVFAPLLFSETMKLHPIAVIVAVILFGGLFGFWGVFFAIPLATVVKAVINAWLEYRKPVPSH